MLRSIVTTVAAACCLSAPAVAQDAADKTPAKLPAAPANAAAEANPTKIFVGAREISVPLPEGFVRCDGISKDFDQMVAGFLPPTNRLVAYFATAEDAAALRAETGSGHERSFNIQVIREVENREIGQATFASVRGEIKKGLDASKANADAEVRKVIDQGKAKVKDKRGVDVDLDVTSTTFVGYFDDSDTSLGFSMLLKSREKNEAGEDVTSRTVVAAALVPVNGRLLGLYGNFPYKTEGDREQAEAAVSKWRDALVNANPKVQGQPMDSFEKNLGKIVGGVLGFAIVALVVNRLKGRKQQPPPPPSNYLSPQG